MCSGSESGSYLRLIDFVCTSTLGLRVIKKKRRPQFKLRCLAHVGASLSHTHSLSLTHTL